MKTFNLVRPIIVVGSLLKQLSAFAHLRARRASLWSAVLLVSGIFALTNQTARAAVTEAWLQRYNSPANDNDYGPSVAIDKSGNIVVTGTSFNGTNYDCHTVKYASNGAMVWEKRFNGPLDGHDSPSAIAADANGNVVVAGSANEDMAGTVSAFYTAKYAAADGTLLWERFYDGPVSGYNYVSAMALDSSGNVAVTGYSENGTNGDYYTAKYAGTNGALLWGKRYDGQGPGDGYDRYDQPNGLAVDASGNVIVTGFSSTTNGNTEYYTAKYSATNGALLWEQRYNEGVDGSGQANAIAVDTSGNVVVTGSSDNGTNGGDYYTAKYAAADGALLWEKRYNGPANAWDFANAVKVDASGNVAVTGVSANGTNMDFYTAKYAAADGALLWAQRYNGPGNGDDEGLAVSVDENGNVVVTGYSAGSGGNTDYYTAKYAAANGALLWEKRYNGPANENDYAISVALGPNGLTVITGSSEVDNSGVSDFATIAYWENLPPLSIAPLSGGIRLSFLGVSGSSYSIERAPTVTGPWSTLATPAAPLAGLTEYLDTNAPPGSAFYRVSSP